MMNPSSLKKIEDTIDFNVMYSFIPLMFVKNETINRLATEKVNAILNTIPLHFLNKIDEKIRKSNFSKHYSQIIEHWSNLEPSIIDFHKDHSIESFTKLKILCCHPNGHIRYQAIKTLAENSIKDAIPFLIIRAHDWVEKIRVLCIDFLNHIIKNELIYHFIESLPLLAQLKIKERAEHRFERIQLITMIESILATQCPDILLRKINAHEIIISRYAFTILAEADSKIEQLLTATLNSTDIIIKINAFNLASKRYDHANFLIYINKIKNDKLMFIRKIVLYALVEHYPHQAKEALEEGLFDRSHSIRNLSRYYLRQQGICDFSNYYREALIKQDKTIKQAILGLGESGKRQDFRYIRPFINKNSLTLNASIIDAVFKMQPKDWKNIISQLLSNPDSAILRSFTNCLSENQGSYTFAEILALVYKKNNLMHTRYLIRILSNGHYDRWDVLNFILRELETITDHDIKVIFEKYLYTWIHHNSPNKIFTYPCHEKLKTSLYIANNLLKDAPTISLYKELLENIRCFIK